MNTDTQDFSHLRALAAELDMPQIPSKKCQHGSAIAMRQAADTLDALQAEVAGLRAERENNLDSIRTGNNIINRLNARLAAMELPATVPDQMQDWKGMDGTTAWHLIERHADNWADVGKMMNEWLAANQAAGASPVEPAQPKL